MRLSADDVLLIHQAAMRDLPQPSEAIGARELAQLERILDLADIGSADDAVVLAADIAVQLALHRLFPNGNDRTAVLVAAVIIDAAGYKLPADWTELSDLLLSIRRSSKGPGWMSEQVRGWLRQQGCGSGA